MAVQLENPHAWNVSIAEAKAIQQQLAARVETQDRLGEVHLVAGVDVGFEQMTARAAIAVLRFPELELADWVMARRAVTFPYVPGLLSFRECPVILDGLGQLQILPDLLLCDGQGVAHPRRCGIACHLGVITGLPTVGVAKSRLLGTHAAVPEGKGEWCGLYDQGERIGAVLRTRAGAKPLFISPGHRISLESSIRFVMACVTRYRLPETTRWADGLASQRGSQWLQRGQQAKGGSMRWHETCSHGDCDAD